MTKLLNYVIFLIVIVILIMLHLGKISVFNLFILGPPTTRKRKRPNNANLFADVLRETIGALDQTIVAAIDNLGEKLSNKFRQTDLDKKACDLSLQVRLDPQLALRLACLLICLLNTI